MAGKPAIKIKKSTKGSFTAAAKKAGKTVPQETAAVLSNPKSSPAMRKKAQFAKNARSWGK